MVLRAARPPPPSPGVEIVRLRNVPLRVAADWVSCRPISVTIYLYFYRSDRVFLGRTISVSGEGEVLMRRFT